MSFDGLTDPLRFYTVATVVTVVLTMVLLAVLRLREAWTPLRTWFVILPVALGAMWLGHGAWVVLVTLISLFGF